MTDICGAGRPLVPAHPYRTVPREKPGLARGSAASIRCWAVLVLLGVMGGLVTHSTRGASVPPNFVVILVDDLGWTDLGCMGSKFYETPHLDRLASQSMRFTQAYSACTVCSPTRAALLTGLYPARLHLTDWIP